MTYYTYIHATPDGNVFYVGKGTGRRVYSTRDRTVHWRSIVQKHEGVMMRIVSHFDTEQEAFEHEKALIDMYKSQGCDLVNLTDGGRGPLGYRFTEEVRRLKSEQMKGYKHKQVTCPHCGITGGEPSLRRWHFDNCTGVKPTHKIRTTVFGKRVYLGKEHAKESADSLAKEFYDFAMDELSRLGRQLYWTVV